MLQFLALWVSCLLIMLGIDFYLGASAEFLNAWSVVERAFGREPSAGDSAIYRSFGAIGEAFGVLLATFFVASLLLIVFRRFVG